MRSLFVVSLFAALAFGQAKKVDDAALKNAAKSAADGDWLSYGLVRQPAGRVPSAGAPIRAVRPGLPVPVLMGPALRGDDNRLGEVLVSGVPSGAIAHRCVSRITRSGRQSPGSAERLCS